MKFGWLKNYVQLHKIIIQLQIGLEFALLFKSIVLIKYLFC